MNYETAKLYLLSKPEAVESYPFYPDTLVPKVRGKMFATLSHRRNQCEMNLKCNPDEAIALQDLFPAIRPGYHMNKKHWITVTLDGSIPDGEIKRLIDGSYKLVVQKLPRFQRIALLEQTDN